MKKTEKNVRTTKKNNDLVFAEKILSQIVVSVVIFVLVFVNSHLHNSVSVNINNQIKHYLTSNIDFNKTIDVAVLYFQNFLKQVQTLPVNKDLNVDFTEAEQ